MKLDNFEIGKCLGKGGFGNVYEATFICPGALDKQVALKQVKLSGPDSGHGCVIYKERDINILLQPSERILKMLGCFFATMTTESYFVFEIARGKF